MKKLLLSLAMLFACILPAAHGQVQLPPPQDTSRAGAPILELPEITIVGKKAITLPFARKGEIFDVNIYEPPPVDSSFMLSRPSLSLPVGQYNRLAERISPWHASAGGEYGSFATLGLNGFLSYAYGNWDLYGRGEYLTTQGDLAGFSLNSTGVQIDNPRSAHSVRGMVGAKSILSTDNDLLKGLSFGLNAEIMKDSYKNFLTYALTPSGSSFSSYTDESRNAITVSGSIGTVHREGFVFDLNLSARMWSVDFPNLVIEASTIPVITAAMPTLSSSLSADVGRFRFSGDLTYESASLDYRHATQSPSLFGSSSGLRWQLIDRWYLYAGAYFGFGSGSDGKNSTLVMPSANLRWDIDGLREFSVWWKPEMHLTSYDSVMRQNPYLWPELAIRPERIPINFGAAFSFDSRVMTFNIQGSYRQSSDRSYTSFAHNGLVDDAIGIGYTDAVESQVQVNGSLTPFRSFRVSYDGTLQRTTADTNDVQLPMTPGILVTGKAEYDLPRLPVTVYGRMKYTGKQNIDFAGTSSIDPYMLIDAGASSNILSNVVLSLDILNLTGTDYVWWPNHPAPGFQVMLGAKVAIR